MKTEKHDCTIKFLMGKLGWPPKQMAGVLGVSQKTLSLIFNKQPLSRTLAIRGAVIFCIAPAWFFANDISKPIPWQFREAWGDKIPEETILKMLQNQPDFPECCRQMGIPAMDEFVSDEA